jgi:hypothetical protein
MSPDVASAQEQKTRFHLTPSEVKLYQQARTLMDWTPEEIRSRPELQNLQPAESQRGLVFILEDVAEYVAGLYDNLLEITSTEKVQVLTCGPSNDHCTATAERTFRFLLQRDSTEGARVLEEYRSDAKGKPERNQSKPIPFLGSGFLLTALHFQAENWPDSRFRYFGRQLLDGQETEVVGFAQIPEADTSVGVFQSGHTTVHTLEQGLAWIDAATHEILRIQTNLLAPRPDVGLEYETVEIDFTAVHLPEPPGTFRLPTRVTVDFRISHQHIRNIHEYSDFKLFRVESHIRGASKE